MANEEHLAILRQGVEVWNEWRLENREIQPDLSRASLSCTILSGADLSHASLRGAYLIDTSLNYTNFSGADLIGTDLRGASLSYTNLRGADLSRASLFGADLSYTNLRGANFRSANLRGASLFGANFRSAKLRGANFIKADLGGANLSDADLSDADLKQSILWSANLSETKLQNADFTDAILSKTIFADTDLSNVKGLVYVAHNGPSEISISTLYKSGGNIPEAFLRGCGLSDWQIENAKLFNPDLSNDEFIDIQYRMRELRFSQAIQIKPLFISYSHKDAAFVDHIEERLNQKGVRYWRDIHHATSGRLERQIDSAIRSHPVVLLILSAHSVGSDWVQHEARVARKLEQEIKSDVLCPIALDEAWKSCDWPERLREQIEEYNILDFSKWQDAATSDRMFARLIEGLGIFYK